MSDSTEKVAQGLLSVDDALEHYGAKGMKWGIRKNKAASTGPSRKELRAKNRVARKENYKSEKAKSDANDASIKAARAGLSTASKNYKTAKATYKVEKKQIGSVAAKRALRESGDKYTSMFNKAGELTRREEIAVAAVHTGALVAQGVMASKAAKREREEANA